MSDLDRDYARAAGKSNYRGFRRVLHTWTSPGFQAVASYRFTRWLMQKRIPPEAKIGPGLLIFHFGGIIINSQAVMGEDCTLHHGVTVGNRVSGGASPVIGDRVMIGAGAKVLGDIRIGHDVEIGANSVVLDSLEDGAVAVGIPARVVRVKKAPAPEAGQ